MNNNWQEQFDNMYLEYAKKQVIKAIEAEVKKEPNHEVGIGMCHIIRIINKI